MEWSYLGGSGGICRMDFITFCPLLLGYVSATRDPSFMFCNCFASVGLIENVRSVI
jgi:hypothetical protein